MFVFVLVFLGVYRRATTFDSANCMWAAKASRIASSARRSSPDPTSATNDLATDTTLAPARTPLRRS